MISLLGVSILAKDGNIGHVRDVLFNDHSWVLRYFVVETGSWFSGRRVLLSPTIFFQPDWDKRVLPVDLTIDEVRQSPDVDTDLPVYRQQEVTMAQYYGWPAYWTIETPLHKETNPPEGDSNLRGATEILTYKVKSTDGDLGSMDDLIVEDANWFIRFFVLSAAQLVRRAETPSCNSMGRVRLVGEQRGIRAAFARQYLKYRPLLDPTSLRSI